MAKLFKEKFINNIPQLKFGLYGPPGQGKTTLAAQFATDPRTGPALWLDIAGNPQRAMQKYDLPFVLSLEKPEDVLSPLNYLLTGQQAAHPFYQEWGQHFPDNTPFKLLVVDTMSDWQGQLINQLTGVDKEQFQNLDIHTLAEIEPPDPRKHGKEIAARTLYVGREMLFNLPIHVILVFQEFSIVSFTGEEGKITGGQLLSKIDLYGQSKDKLPAWMNLMGRMKFTEVLSEKGKQLQPIIAFVDSEAHVKNQVAKGLGKKLPNPTAAKILDLIEKDFTENK